MEDEKPQTVAPQSTPVPAPNPTPESAPAPTPEPTPAPEQVSGNAIPMADSPPKPFEVRTGPKSNKLGMMIGLILLLIAIVGIGIGMYSYSHKAKPVVKSSTPTATKFPTTTQPAASKLNKSTYSYAIGYVTYDNQKLKTIAVDSTLVAQYTKLATTDPSAKNSHVVFFTNYSGTTKTLLMYDIKTSTSYVVATGSSDHQTEFSNPVILSDHYVAFYTLTYTTPVKLDGSVSVMDLQTGQTQQLLADGADKLPASSCCTVSTDGLYLSIINPSTNSLGVYAAGGDKLQTITVPGVTFQPVTTGSTSDTYTQAQNAAGYPSSLVWLDNHQLVLAKASATRYVVDKDGDHMFANPNGLVTLDTTAGTTQAFNDLSKFAVTWFGLTDKYIVFTAYDTATGDSLAGGPEGSNVNLYVQARDGSITQYKLNTTPFTKASSIVVDNDANLVYVQPESNPSTSVPATSAYNLTSRTSKVLTGTPSGWLSGLAQSGKLVYTAANQPPTVYEVSTSK